MIVRHDNLEAALGEIEAERLVGASTIVVNLGWWTGLPVAQQEAYRRLGFTFLGCSTDSGLLADGAERVAQELKALATTQEGTA